MSSAHNSSPAPETPINTLKQTFSNLDLLRTGQIEKETLRQAILYTGDNYDRDIIHQ